MSTQVAIIGAGPAGLVLAHLLERQGISCVVLETRSRDYVQRRVRAGVLEQGTVDLLAELGLDARLRRESLAHDGVEWRIGRRAHRIPVRELTGGRGVTVYGQQELVKDLIGARLDTGRPLVFEVEDVELHDLDGLHPRVTYFAEGERCELECDFFAGCDGSHGVSRSSVPAGAISWSVHDYPFAWLGILADVAPSTEDVIYAHSDGGFALHSMRSPRTSRLYLQCDAGDRLSEWSDDRIWQELQLRLAVDDDWDLHDGPIVDRSITAMRSVVAEPMQYGRLFLAGDAAHVVPPTGAKGLNQAVADVVVLGQALGSWYRTSSRTLLESYSSICLRRVWQVQQYAAWMTWMFHSWNGDEFVGRLQAMQLRSACTSGARSIAENYAGLPIEATLDERSAARPWARRRRGAPVLTTTLNVDAGLLAPLDVTDGATALDIAS
jgi:p-hydroxybenzoate 3-monooxygenase